MEMVLGRICVDVSRATYLLRTNSDQLSPDAVTDYAGQQQRFLDTALGGGLHELAFAQAAAGVHDGGLGFRTAARTQTIAALASLVEARPYVDRIVGDMAAAGVVLPHCMSLYDGRVDRIMAQVLAGLPPKRAEAVHTCCCEAAVAAKARLEGFMQGRRGEAPGAPVGNGHAGARLALEPGAGDPERPQASQEHLQRKLARIIDAQVLDDVAATLARLERWPDVRRLRELRDEAVSHDWLWAVGPGAGGNLEPARSSGNAVLVGNKSKNKG